MKLIGIAGNARSGKDTMGKFFSEALNTQGIKTKRVSFAWELKNSVNDFVLGETGISAFTTDDAEKKAIRPFLVCWGTEIMRRIDPNIWINKLEASCDPHAINIITDLRFENELDWIQTNDSISVLLKRSGIDPANIYEEENNAILASKVDGVFHIANVEDPNTLRPIARNILTLFLDEEKLELWKATCPL